MFNFYVDALGDMYGEELAKNGLNLAPSKLQCGDKIINFEGYGTDADTADIIGCVREQKCDLIPLTADEWFDFFSQDIERGLDVIFFSISFNLRKDKGKAIKEAFAKLNKTYPNSKAILVNTQTFSRGTSEIASLAHLVYTKTDDIDQALDFAETIIGKFVSIIALDSVNNLKNSPLLCPIASQFFGSSLNLMPLVSIDTEGKFRLFDKAKGYKSAVSKLYSNVKQNGLNVADYTFSIVYFDAEKEARELYDRFRKIVTENEIRLVPMSPQNATLCGGKCISLTFHSRF